MTASSARGRRTALVVLAMIAVGMAGCGGNGDDGGRPGGPTRTPTPRVTNPGQVGTPTPTLPPGVATPTRTPTGAPAGTRTPTPTATRTVPPGSTATPTPTPTSAPEIIVPPGANLRAYIRRAPANATLIVSPGTYAALAIGPEDLNGPIVLFADTEGAFSETAPADVVINAGIRPAAVELRGVSDVTLDGFTLVGGSSAALLAVDSDAVIVANCTIRRSQGHGAVFERSDDGLFFNNLVHNNAGTGLRVLGSDLLFAINNTVYGNGADGIYVGASGTRASANLLLTNNIVNRNRPLGINIDTRPPSSLTGYFGDYNLNSDGYGPGTPPGPNDINGRGSASDPQFVFPAGGNFRLAPTSPAVNAGDPETDPGLLDFLLERTTQADQSPDVEPVDLGYHYPIIVTPTPTR